MDRTVQKRLDHIDKQLAHIIALVHSLGVFHVKRTGQVIDFKQDTRPTTPMKGNGKQ